MHPAPMWPIHNYYVCPRCQRQWPVFWVNEQERAATLEHRAVRLQPATQSRL